MTSQTIENRTIDEAEQNSGLKAAEPTQESLFEGLCVCICSHFILQTTFS